MLCVFFYLIAVYNVYLTIFSWATCGEIQKPHCKWYVTHRYNEYKMNPLKKNCDFLSLQKKVVTSTTFSFKIQKTKYSTYIFLYT